MGHYIVKIEHNNSSVWALKNGEALSILKEQPSSLRALIEDQHHFLNESNTSGETINIDTAEVLAPVSSPLRVVCQGLNYADHREEAKLATTSKGNVLFTKDESSISSAYGDIVRPKDAQCLDYEVELGFIMRKDITQPVTITEDNLHEYVAGLVLANDMSPRDLQYKDDYAQWFKGKSGRTMLPLGPVLYLMEKDDFKHLYNLEVKLWVNGELRQNANTSQLIFKPSETLTEISSFMNLSIGDLILTGTPGGVVIEAPSKFLQGVATWLLSNEAKVAALRRKKDNYLQNGDVIKTKIFSPGTEIDLGFQENKIVPYQH